MSKLRRWSIFVGSLVLGLFLWWFGSRFLLFSSLEVTALQYGIVAAISLCFAVMLIDAKSKESVVVCGLLAAIGLYAIVRAFGFMEVAWLARCMAALCWLWAVCVVAASLPIKRDKLAK